MVVVLNIKKSYLQKRADIEVREVSVNSTLVKISLHMFMEKQSIKMLISTSSSLGENKKFFSQHYFYHAPIHTQKHTYSLSIHWPLGPQSWVL